MVAIPQPDDIGTLIDQYHESKTERPRLHLGCSILGHPCDRWLWLSFRWAVTPEFSGRILRLFRRGHMEEATIISDLRAIGIDVRETEKQTHVSFGCHISGSVDAVINRGVPGAEKTKHIAEFKTHSLKSFNELDKIGLEKSKPQHFIQMQLYMHGTKIDRGLYLAICKDDDRIYTERVKYDKKIAEQYLERGKRIALSDRMPEPISADPSWYQCRFCDAHDFCHQSKQTKNVNCRTCAHSTAKEDSTWHCERYDAPIPPEYQRMGCDAHVLHPDLVPWQRADSDDEWQAVYIINGTNVTNGEHGYKSTEIIANADLCASGNDIVNQLRTRFDGRIIG